MSEALPVLQEPQRCTGHCCELFTLPYDPSDVKRMAFDAWRRGFGTSAYGTRVRGALVLSDMLIPRGFGNLPQHTPAQATWLYTCRHYDKEAGLCGIYERRPSMCRCYPYGRTCEFEGCTLSGGVGVEDDRPVPSISELKAPEPDLAALTPLPSRPSWEKSVRRIIDRLDYAADMINAAIHILGGEVQL